MIIQIPTPIIQKFFSKTKENENGCLEWTACLCANGYGRFQYNKKSYKTHRFAWIIKNGIIPNDRIICHTCDNPKCVNIKHLWIGTDKENIHARMKRGKHKKKCLTQEQENNLALSYYTSYATITELAKQYHISKTLAAKTIRMSQLKSQYKKTKIKKHKHVKVTPEIRSKILKLKAKGVSRKKIAALFKISINTVQYHFNIETARKTRYECRCRQRALKITR